MPSELPSGLARRARRLGDCVYDLRYALRTLRNSRGFTLTAALTIALGIGASTAIFSVTNAVLLRPLPYRNPDRLVLASMDLTKRNVRDWPFSNADFLDLRDGTSAVFADMGAVFTFRVIVPREDGRPERIYKAQVTTNFLGMMGAKIAFGRDITDADGQPQPTQPQAGLPVGSVAILSHEYWQRRYGGNAAVIGQEMLRSGQRGPRIIGVLEPGFELFFPPAAGIERSPDVWTANNLGYDRSIAALRVIGRLRSGVSLGRAQKQVEAFEGELRKNIAGGATPGLHIRLEPMLRHLVAEVRPALLALMGAVVFLLLIACANVANLMLVRASLRERELAVRAALGGSRWRLVRQKLAEAILLSALGTLLGMGLAWIGVRELLVIAPANLPRLESVAIDWSVLAFAAVAGLLATAVFGVMPVLRAARPDVMQVLRGGGRTAGPGAGRLLRNGVVVAEVALSFVLLIGSGLMFRSFLKLQRIDPGYDPRGVLTFLLVRDWRGSEPQRTALLQEIQGRLRALPGVENLAASALFPLTRAFPAIRWGTEQALADPTKFQAADFQKAFPNESAVGKRLFITWLGKPVPLEVIGVVAHQRYTSHAEPGHEQLYLTDGFAGFGVGRYWAIRTTGDPAPGLARRTAPELAGRGGGDLRCS